MRIVPWVQPDHFGFPATLDEVFIRLEHVREVRRRRQIGRWLMVAFAFLVTAAFVFGLL